ncbi:hypothetical protein BDZ89DRAFT_1148425 [Hymenopellis radicata]|nr:hypothetical protein BDZ89DRAFT_1148425 [Hymenopellis radicata]
MDRRIDRKSTTQLHSDDITHPLESTYAKSVSTTQPRATLPAFINDITLTANKPTTPDVFGDLAASEHVSLFDLLNTLPIAGVPYPLMISGRPHRNTFTTTLVKKTLAAYLKDPRTPNTEATPILGMLPVQAPMAVDRPRITLPLPQRAPRVPIRPKRKLKEEETSDGSQRIVKSKHVHAFQILQNDNLARFIMSLPDPPVLCAGQQLLVLIPGFVRVNGQDAVNKLKWLKYLLTMNQFKLSATTKKTDDRTQGSRNVSALKVETSPPRVNATAPVAGVSVSKASVTSTPNPAAPMQTHPRKATPFREASFDSEWGNAPFDESPFVFKTRSL